MHVFADAEQALELAQQVTEKPVVARSNRPVRPVVIKTDDGAETIAAVIYPVERLGSSSAAPEIAQTQVASIPNINPEMILRLIEEERRKKRRRIAAMLLL